MFVSMKFSAFTERVTLATNTTAHQQHTLAPVQQIGQTSINISGQQLRSTNSINHVIMSGMIHAQLGADKRSYCSLLRPISSPAPAIYRAC
jgi:hypothetical protein